MDPMAPRRFETLLSVSLVMAFWGVTMGQTQSDCTNVIISLSPCLDYVTGSASAPSAACCSQLASVAMSQPRCLCEVANGGVSSVGLNINQTRALALPSDCRVQTPPVSSCHVSSPTGTPAFTSNFPSGSGSNTVQSRSGGSGSGGRSSSRSRGNSTKLPSSELVLFLLAISLTLTSTTASPIWPHIF